MSTPTLLDLNATTRLGPNATTCLVFGATSQLGAWVGSTGDLLHWGFGDVSFVSHGGLEDPSMKRIGRTSMDRFIQVVKMRQAGHGINKIATSLKMCKKTVRRLLETQDGSVGDESSLAVTANSVKEPLIPDWLKALDSETLVKEVRKGVSYRILFEEQKGLSVSYWTFWNTLSRLSKMEKAPATTMRMRHNPGEKTFVDYTDGIDLYCPKAGEIISTQLFVGTLPFSSLVYAEFSFNQKLPSFIESHERMWT